MKRIIFALFVLCSCTQGLEQVGNTTGSVPTKQEETRTFIPGSVIVQLDEEFADRLASTTPDVKSNVFGNTLEDLGIIKMERLYPDAGEWEERHREAGLHRWYRMTFNPELRISTKASDDFASLPGVVYTEPERRIKSSSYFNDPFAPRQWSLYNDGTNIGDYYAGCDINVVPVWDNYTAGSPKVIVAVLDHGVQLDHPDLAANTLPGGDNGSKSFVNGREGYTIHPGDHGTHVAGVIAAVNNNETGICGIAGGRDGQGVKIMSCAIMMPDPNDPNKTVQGDAYGAMVWAADHGAVISQNSWGYVYDDQEAALKSGPGAIKPAIDYFIKYAGCDKNGEQRPDSPMKGGVVFFSAGNDGWTIGWPAAYEKVLAVGAIGADFERSYYSNYGDWVDICAPGGDSKKNTLILSTVTNGQYATMQGTSMACPHVSGVAALIVSWFGGPGFTNEMLKERLLDGANTKKVFQGYKIGPLVDALGSFTYTSKVAPVPASGITYTASSNYLTLSWKVTPDPDDVKTYGYLAVLAKDANALKGLKPNSIPDSVISIPVLVGTTPIGESISVTVPDLEFETNYSVAVFAYDYAGNYSELSEVSSARTERNNPPEITADYTGSYSIKSFEKISVIYSISDPDGHTFTIDVDPGSDAFSFKKTSGEVKGVITGNGAPAGKYTAHIVATDSYGAATDYSIQYELLENHAPVVVSEVSNMRFTSTGQSQTLDMTQFIKDEDGEQLSYKISSSDQSVAHLNISENTLYITTLAFGLTSVTITGTDSRDTSCSVSFKILVQDSSTPLSIYPNPVSTNLYIRPADDGNYNVSISNKAGAVVLSTSSDISVFEPLAIDVSGLSSGTYYVRITGNGLDNLYTIAKI